MTQKYKTATVFFVVAALVLSTFSLAKTADELPVQPGTYAVPGHANMHLRVFVHGQKPARPGPTPTPTLTCNLSDPQSSTVDGTTGWYLPASVDYVLNVSSVPSSVGQSNLATIASNGFDAWTNAIGNKLTLHYSGTTTVNRAKYDGQNIISWGRIQPSALGVTYVWYYNSGEVAEVDTLLNNKYNWTWSAPSTWGNSVCAYQQTYDAQNILTHELGHWFGLDDNYDASYQDNTMYGYGDMTETKKDTLTTGDSVAINSIY